MARLICPHECEKCGREFEWSELILVGLVWTCLECLGEEEEEDADNNR